MARKSGESKDKKYRIKISIINLLINYDIRFLFVNRYANFLFSNEKNFFLANPIIRVNPRHEMTRDEKEEKLKGNI